MNLAVFVLVELVILVEFVCMYVISFIVFCFFKVIFLYNCCVIIMVLWVWKFNLCVVFCCKLLVVKGNVGLCFCFFFLIFVIL